MEVEGEKEGAGDEDGAVGEADEEGGDVGPVFEETERHYGVDCEFPFVEEKETDGDETEDD